MNEENYDLFIPKDMVAKVLEELQDFVNDKVSEIDRRISDEKYRASEYYLSDMEGFSRGLYRMGNDSIEFLKSRILGKQ